MLQKFRILLYPTIIGVILLFPVHSFSGPTKTNGCHSYGAGEYLGMAFFGSGVAEEFMTAGPVVPKYRICFVGSSNIASKDTQDKSPTTAALNTTNSRGAEAQARIAQLEKELQKYKADYKLYGNLSTDPNLEYIRQCIENKDLDCLKENRFPVGELTRPLKAEVNQAEGEDLLSKTGTNDNLRIYYLSLMEQIYLNTQRTVELLQALVRNTTPIIVEKPQARKRPENHDQ